jgi:hypothetical protein
MSGLGVPAAPKSTLKTESEPSTRSSWTTAGTSSESASRAAKLWSWTCMRTEGA